MSFFLLIIQSIITLLSIFSYFFVFCRFSLSKITGIFLGSAGLDVDMENANKVVSALSGKDVGEVKYSVIDPLNSVNLDESFNMNLSIFGEVRIFSLQSF